MKQPVSRVDDPIGLYRPMLAVTGVLTRNAVAEWGAARAQYYAAETVEFAPDFDDDEIGYWGRPGDLRRIERTLDRRYPGPQTDKFRPLGQSSWREVLSASPAEPGLSAGVPLATPSAGLVGCTPGVLPASI